MNKENMLKRFSMLASLTIFAGATLTITTTTTMHQPNEAYAQTFPPTIPSTLPSTIAPPSNNNNGIQIDNSANIDCDDKCDADVRQDNTIVVDPSLVDTIFLPTPQPFQP